MGWVAVAEGAVRWEEVEACIPRWEVEEAWVEEEAWGVVEAGE